MNPGKKFFILLLSAGFAYISIGWTIDLLSDIIDDPGRVIVLALLLNALEAFCISLAVHFWREASQSGAFKHAFYCFASAASCLLVAAISITGSFGGFQTGFQKNVAESSQYAAAQTDLEIKQEAAKNLARNMGDEDTYLVANREYKKAQAEAQLAKTNLDALMESGTGEGNAIYQAYAEMWGVTAEAVAGRGNLAVGGIVECIMLLLFLIYATEAQPIATMQTKVAQLKTPVAGWFRQLLSSITSTNGSRNAPTIRSGSGDDTQLQVSQRQLILSTNTQVIAELGRQNFAEVARRCGVSRQYVSRVVRG